MTFPKYKQSKKKLSKKVNLLTSAAATGRACRPSRRILTRTHIVRLIVFRPPEIVSVPAAGILTIFLVESWHSEVSKMVWHLKIGPLVQKLDIFLNLKIKIKKYLIKSEFQFWSGSNLKRNYFFRGGLVLRKLVLGPPLYFGCCRPWKLINSTQPLPYEDG